MRTIGLPFSFALAIAMLLASLNWVRLYAQEGGSEPTSPGSTTHTSVNDVIGDDPDEDGYTGPVDVGNNSFPQSEVNIIQVDPSRFSLESPQPDENGYFSSVYHNDDLMHVSSEFKPASVVDWEALINESQPDQEIVSNEEQWTTFYYMFAAGSTMRPRDSQTGWEYGGGGCVSSSVNYENFTLHLDLPEGSRVDYLRIFYYDVVPANSRAWLTRYDGSGGLQDIATVASSGETGYGTALSSYIGHVVDNLSQSYVLNWKAYTTGSEMRLCGLRIAYRLPE